MHLHLQSAGKTCPPDLVSMIVPAVAYTHLLRSSKQLRHNVRFVVVINSLSSIDQSPFRGVLRNNDATNVG